LDRKRFNPVLHDGSAGAAGHRRRGVSERGIYIIETRMFLGEGIGDCGARKRFSASLQDESREESGPKKERKVPAGRWKEKGPATIFRNFPRYGGSQAIPSWGAKVRGDPIEVSMLKRSNRVG